MSLWTRLRDRWWERQRALDVQLLWPACKQQAQSIDHARAAFMVHAMHSPCWEKHYGSDLIEIVGALP